MQSLRECLEEAKKTKTAIGHFNVSNSEMINAVWSGAKKTGSPVIIGLSEGERDFMGTGHAAAFVRSIREEFNYPIFLNADHTYSFERVKEAIDAGFDSVIFDGASLPFAENVKITRECVGYARKINPEIIIEGELGFIGKSSKILDELPEGVDLSPEGLTSPEEAKKFMEEGGVDIFAPAVGNMHGMLVGGKDPKLNIERIKEISEAVGKPLVLHGGSGNSAEEIKEAIKAGIRIVHINTEIRLAYRKALQISLSENPEEIAPYKYMKGPVLAVEKLVEEKLQIFSKI